MSKLAIVMALALLGGCAAEEADSVASQQSAVEEAPAPQTEEEMRITLQACNHLCGNQLAAADLNCINWFRAHYNYQLYDACETAANADRAECSMQCERSWGSHGCGDHCL